MTCYGAEPLTFVTSLAQEKAWKSRPSAGDRSIGLDDATHSFKVQRKEFGVHMPQPTETSRSRIKLLGMGFGFARVKFSSRRAIASTSLELWDRYTNYLFGEEVWGMNTFAKGAASRHSGLEARVDLRARLPEQDRVPHE